jgi:hypothetical protein
VRVQQWLQQQALAAVGRQLPARVAPARTHQGVPEVVAARKAAAHGEGRQQHRVLVDEQRAGAHSFKRGAQRAAAGAGDFRFGVCVVISGGAGKPRDDLAARAQQRAGARDRVCSF